jgi:hypothetical protein
LKYTFDLALTSFAKPFLKRTMMENIIFNPSSVLDVLAHEINEIYNFNVDFTGVQIDHRSKKVQRKRVCEVQIGYAK